MSKPASQKVVPFLRRVRTQGLAQVARDHHIDPRTRIPLEYQRLRWRMRHGAAGQAVPVYVVGLQRSGTNMLVRAFQNSVETQVFNENDRRAFHVYSLRDMEVVRRLVIASPRRVVVFKPLKDSDRIVDILEDPAMPGQARAIWAYRSFEGRVRSSLGQFDDNNLTVLRAAADGASGELWQTRFMGPRLLELVRSLDVGSMNPESAAGLMWYLRNSLFFELALDRRDDVAVVSYERLLAHPESVLEAVAGFVGISFDPRMTSHIERRAPAIRSPIAIDSSVLDLCEDLERRLDHVALGGPAPVPSVGAQP